MRVLFIQPPDSQIIPAETPHYDFLLQDHYPPLGMMSIATCVNEWTDHEARVLDAAVLGMSYKGLESSIRRERPDVVGLSSTSFTVLGALASARLVKGIDPEIQVVMGGSHADRFPSQTIKQEGVNFAITGEGEYSFIRLLEHLEGKRRLREVPGAVGYEKGKVVRGKKPDIIRDLDTLPIVDRTLTPYKRYSSVFARLKPGTIATTSRGCPYRCSFCYLPLRPRTSLFRCRSPEKMVKEMRSCAELGIREVMFYDDTFTLQRPRILRFCELLIKEGLDITWDMRTRADLLDRDLLRKMKQAGLRRVQIGGESGTQEGLDSIQKGLTLQQIRDAFLMINSAGLDSLGYFILGLPGETEEMMRETVRFAMGLDMSYANFSIFTPLPDSPIWDKLLAEGDTSVRDAWEGFAARPSLQFDAPICNSHYTKEDLLKALDAAYKAFYLRPAFVLRELGRIRTPRDALMKVGIVSGIAGSWLRDAVFKER